MSLEFEEELERLNLGEKSKKLTDWAWQYCPETLYELLLEEGYNIEEAEAFNLSSEWVVLAPGELDPFTGYLVEDNPEISLWVNEKELQRYADNKSVDSLWARWPQRVKDKMLEYIESYSIELEGLSLKERSEALSVKSRRR
jgi:hypothetical protein